MNRKPVMLMILDGFGINPNEKGNAVAIANTPDINIQNILPTPPIIIAVATPIIFPVPKVAASTAIIDLNELIPSFVFFLSLVSIYFKPLKVYFWGNFNLNVNNICVVIKTKTSGKLHTIFSINSTILVILSPFIHLMLKDIFLMII